MKRTLAVASLASVAFLATPSTALADEPEDLLGVSFDFSKGEVTIDVASHGCTAKEHFAFALKGDELLVTRKTKDECKAMPEKLRLSYTLKEAGIDPNKPFKFANRFIVNELTANVR